jgi:hypothetical protein
MIQFKIVYGLQNEPNLSSYLQMLVFGALVFTQAASSLDLGGRRLARSSSRLMS